MSRLQRPRRKLVVFFTTHKNVTESVFLYDWHVSLCRNATIWVNVTVTLDSRLQHAANLATVEAFTVVPSNPINVLQLRLHSFVRVVVSCV